MGPLKKNVTCMIVIFILFTCVTLCQFSSITSSITSSSYALKIKSYGAKEKKIFCIYDCFGISRYIKGGRKLHF